MYSGATSHLTNSLDLMSDLKGTNMTFTTASSDQLKAEAIGKIKTNRYTLSEVAYVPKADSNLLSVNSICRNGGEVLFKSDEVVISKDGKPAVRGRQRPNGIYVVDLDPTVADGHTALKVTPSVNYAHRLMGHLGINNLKKLTNMSVGLNFDSQGDLNCDVCAKAKQAKKPFTGELPAADRVLQIVCSDVGQMNLPDFEGNRYYVTLLDVYTHFAEVHLMKAKSEVAEICKAYILRVQNEKNCKVSVFKCDNGTEYFPLYEFLKENGTSLDLTVPYCPELNGRAERLNRTLCEKMRALLFDSGVDKELWGVALQTSCYLANRSPYMMKCDTPYEMWHGKPPNLSNLQLFGCVAYSKVPNTKKLDEKSVKRMFVGYTKTGYRLWNDEKRCIEVARHVTFLPIEEKLEIDRKNPLSGYLLTLRLKTVLKVLIML